MALTATAAPPAPAGATDRPVLPPKPTAPPSTPGGAVVHPTSATSPSVTTVAEPSIDTPVAPGPSTQPQAMTPKAAERRKPKVIAAQPTRTPQRGDLICAPCGEANVPTRKFCSRCGESLISAAVVRVPWWRRLLRRRPKEFRAGERPWKEKGSPTKNKRRRQGFGRVIRPIRRFAAVALLVGGLVYGVYQPFRTRVNDTYSSARTKVMSVIHPTFDSVTAGPGTTSNIEPPTDPDHPGLMATDGFKNTYWIAPPPTTELQPSLDVTLTERSDLARIIVRNGAFDNFQGFDRPKTLLFVYDTGEQETVELKNSPDPQTHTLEHGGGVTRFKIIVTAAYQSIDGKQMALTEVEFFKKH